MAWPCSLAWYLHPVMGLSNLCEKEGKALLWAGEATPGGDWM